MFDPVGSLLRRPRRIRALSLDLDDTLIDTDGAAGARLDAAIACAMQAMQPAPSPMHAADARRASIEADPVVDGRLPVLLAMLKADPDSEAARAIRAAYDGALLSHVRAFDRVVEVLSALRAHYRLVITTNGPVALQEAKIRQFDLARLVDGIAISEAVGARKPEAAIFHHACALIEVSPEETAHIGDSWTADVAGAAGAGLATILRQTERPRIRPADAPEPDAIITGLDDLLRTRANTFTERAGIIGASPATATGEG